MKAYQKAGVNLEAADLAVEKLKPLAKRTLRPEVLSSLGGFGGLFALDQKKYKNPVLVSGTDGVGTKLKLAFELDQHETIGIDLVAMCVNDILVQGAEPLFFLDYLACGKLLPQQVESVVRGISEGCLQSGSALLGGETAEMPGMYESGEYDLAGFSVGVVEREKLIDGNRIEIGDVLLGLASSGVHSNGFSLARQIVEEHELDLNDPFQESTQTLGEVLLTPTKIYVKAILNLLKTVEVKGMSHITGGGLPGNVPRMLPEKTPKGLIPVAEIEKGAWPDLPVFSLLRNESGLPEEELFPVFNMGIGFVICIPESVEKTTKDILQQNGEKVYRIGQIGSGNKVEVQWV
ncbi:MAG: phosphoribosylformylglycinamidine cyclo-ligase [SAR324 cluster bacterium]|nr:phosphoribosylformylglycinamidine cyclo-ligase [SAR324 cluster bacterium]MBL7034773.1 phosphoribosylformylglycinamidine cyclo-ligase [SAR324 cluster bacterium]